ncbi:MAG: tetratricopeptide repeat protein, partial [Paludibacter sp.]|nr:tetratricopeptide repeat protein [Paludibacter sp.]
SLDGCLKHQTGTEKISTLITLSDHVVYTSPAAAIVYADEAITLAEKYDATDLRYKALKARGYANGYAGNIAKSMDDMQEGLDYYLSIKDSIKIAEALSDLGYLNQSQAKYDKAFEYYQQSLAIRKSIADEKGIAYSYNSIGALYWRLGKLDEALGAYLPAINYFEKNALEEEAAITIDNIGEIYSEKGEYDAALQHFKRAYKLNLELGHSIQKAKNLISIGKILLNKKEISKSIRYFNKAGAIQQEVGDKDGFALSQYFLGKAYLQQNDMQNALKHFNYSCSASQAIQGNDLLIKSLNQVAHIHYQLGNFQEAYNKLERAQKLNDSIFTLKQTQMTEELKTRYETEKHISENVNLKQSNSKNEIIIRQQKLMLLMLISMGILSILIFWLILQKRKTTDRLQAIELEQRLLRSKMNPHFIFNLLTVIQNNILKNTTREGVNLISSLATLMRLTLENSSNEFISFEKELQTLKLYLTLQQQRYGEQFEVELTTDPVLSAEDILIPPMLAQPFVENAIEHGFTGIDYKGMIRICYSLKGNELHCEVEDNGIGYIQGLKNKKDNIEHHSYGIEITMQRIAILKKKFKLNARVEITDLSVDSKSGTLVKIIMPFKQN